MEAAAHLSLVNTQTGEVVEQDVDLHQQIRELEQELRAKRSQITRLKNENARLMGVEPEAETIIEVLEFWREKCMPNATLVPASERWCKTRDRLREKDVTTGEPAHSPLKLKAAVTGALLSDFHVKHNYLDAKTIFRDSTTVDEHVARAVSFKRRKGVSALTIIDELGASTALAWLADRCFCGQVRMAHLMGGGCGEFDEFTAKVERFIRERAA